MYKVQTKIKKMVCMGDSLTEGWNLGSSKPFPNLLEQQLQVPMVNSGISGDTTNGMLARFKHMAIDHKPSHIMIMGGTNDLWMGVAMQQILANILAMKRLALYHKIETIIGLPTPFYPPDNDYSNPVFTDNESLKHQIQEYRYKLIQFCSKGETAYIDFAAGFNADLMLSDGLHPNARGHELMKNNAIQILKAKAS